MSYGNRYLEGSTVRCTATFAVSGVNTDPTTVTLAIEDPSGNATTYTYAAGTITKSATGVYYKELGPTILDESGTWVYRWTGTGAAAGVAETSIYLTPSEIV